MDWFPYDMDLRNEKVNAQSNLNKMLLKILLKPS